MRELLSQVTAAATLAVSVDDCKADLRIDDTAEDALIESYIVAATKLCSEIVGRKLITETWKYSVSCGFTELSLSLIPVGAITAIEYFDTDNVSQTMNVNDFLLYNYDDGAVLEPVIGFSWPSMYNRRDALNVTFTAGFGAASDIPETITRAIRLTVAHWYENRTGVSMGVTPSEIPFGIHALLAVERVGWVG